MRLREPRCERHDLALRRVEADDVVELDSPAMRRQRRRDVAQHQVRFAALGESSSTPSPTPTGAAFPDEPHPGAEASAAQSVSLPGVRPSLPSAPIGAFDDDARFFDQSTYEEYR